MAAFNEILATGVSIASFIQTDPAGNEGYRRQFETDGNSIVKSFYKTDENAHILAGSTSFSTSESYDFWLIKIKDLGDVLWNYNYGGTGDDKAESMSMTSDGGFIILGTTNSYGAGEKDLWLVKTDENGNKLWDKTYGGPLNDEGKSFVASSDGGFILAGYPESFGEGGKDFYLIKTNENGNVIWSKTFGFSEVDFANDVIEAEDGSYIIVGTTKQMGNEDIWVIKTDLSGNKEWDHITGGDEADTGEAICETGNGDFLVIWSTSSWGAGQ